MPAENELNGRISAAAAYVARNAYLGGELQAAFRQGLNELGAALKPFPESLQVDEPGAAWNPLYRDIPGDTPPTVHGGPPKTEVSTDMSSITEKILSDPKAFLTQQQQGPEPAPAMVQEQPGTRPDQSITAAILGDPKSFLPPVPTPNGPEHQQSQGLGREM